MASFHLAREARAAATSPSDLLRQARSECEAVLGPSLHLQSVPLTYEIRVFFCHEDRWHLAMPIDPSTWIVDQVLALQAACCQPVMTDRAQALIR